MPILSSADHAEREADTPSQGDDAFNRELVAVKYAGSQSAYRNQAVRNQGGWPGRTNFQRDQWYVALVPEQNLGWWESHADFDIAYGGETIAQSFLDDNYLPTEVFGPNENLRLRDRVFEHLGLEASMDEEGYREQLRDIAGVDEDADDGSGGESDSRKADIQDSYERSEYKRAIETMEDEDDEDYLNLNVSNDEMVEFLANGDHGRDDGQVDALLAGRGGGNGGESE